MKGLIWQDDENIIDVVYQTIYGLPIKEAIHIVKLYQEKQLIPINWIKNYASHKASEDLIDCYWHFWEDDVLKMVADWEKENEKSGNSD